MTLSPASHGARRRTAIAAAFALVAGLLTLGAPLSASAEVVGDGPGTLSGTVVKADGTPLEGASIYIGGPVIVAAYTDAAGYYEASGLALGSYYVSTYPSGYQTVPFQTVTLTDESATATANFVLIPYVTGVGTISGQITADGVPLAGQHVSANQYSTGQSESAFTDENGNYVISGLPDGEWQLWSHAGNQYQTVQGPVVVISSSQPDATADIAFLSYPSGTSAISGVITDSATGEPIADVSIQLYGNDVPQHGSTSTNEAGEFAFASLPAGTFTVSFSASGYLWVNEDFVVAPDQTLVADRGLVAKNATVSGHLQLADGTPVAGEFIQAHAVDGQNYGGGTSDENGNFVIGDLGGVAYTLSVGGYGTLYDLQESVVVAVANADTTADFILVPRTTGSLSGYVYLSEDNAYLEPVCATLYSSKSKKAVAEQYIDGEHYGSTEFYFPNLKPGAYTVEIRDCDDDPGTKFDKVFLGGVKIIKDATFVTVAAAEDSWGHGIEFAPRSN